MEQLAVVIFNIVAYLTSTLEFVKFNTVGRQPFAIRSLVAEFVFNFTIIIDLTLFSIDKEQLTRLQASLFLNFRRFELNSTHFRSHQHHIVVRDEVARRAQAVTVEHTAGETSVREQKSGRTVPRLHQDRVVFVERLQVLTDRVLLVERFRNKHRHSVRQAHTRHKEELECVIEGSRVRHTRLNDRVNSLNIAQHLRREHTLARLHPGTVTTDGIDFTIMAKQTERLSQRPAREGIGRETRVHQSQTTGEIVIAQIREVFANLHRGKHTLINDILARKRNNIKILVLDTVLNLLTDDVERTVERIEFFVSYTRNKHLFDIGFNGSRSLTQTLGISRDIAKVHKRKVFPLNFLNHDVEDVLLFFLVLRQKNETGTILTLLRDRNTLKKNEFVRNLQHDSRTVASFVVSAFSTTVAHVFKNL